MAHYVIVGHPVREKMTIEVEEYPGKKFNISIDKRKNEGKNEDPYVFTENFLYSFCHAYEAITKKIRNKVKDKESVYFCTAPQKLDIKNLTFGVFFNEINL